jgi:hypothetical protein
VDLGCCAGKKYSRREIMTYYTKKSAFLMEFIHLLMSPDLCVILDGFWKVETNLLPQFGPNFLYISHLDGLDIPSAQKRIADLKIVCLLW